MYICEQCNKSFASNNKKNSNRFCGYACYHQSLKGISPKHLGRKGCIPWNKGLTSKDDSRIIAGPKHHYSGLRGPRHPLYRSGENSFREAAIKLLGKNCQICNTKTNVHTHHIDGDIINNPLDGSNWQRFCGSCHAKIYNRARNFQR